MSRLPGEPHLDDSFGALLDQHDDLVGIDIYTTLRPAAVGDGPLVAGVRRQLDLFTGEDASGR